MSIRIDPSCLFSPARELQLFLLEGTVLALELLATEWERLVSDSRIVVELAMESVRGMSKVTLTCLEGSNGSGDQLGGGGDQQFSGGAVAVGDRSSIESFLAKSRV